MKIRANIAFFSTDYLSRRACSCSSLLISKIQRVSRLFALLLPTLSRSTDDCATGGDERFESS